MLNSKKTIEKLEQELSEARSLLEVESLKLPKKNQVKGGYYMMNKAAEKNLRILQKNSPVAALIFSVIRENMQIGTNAVTMSNTAFCKIIGISRATVTRGIKHLSDHNYVQIVKVGTTNSYVVNEQVAFAGSVGQRKAVFSATVVAHECEQKEGFDEVKKLKFMPIISV